MTERHITDRLAALIDGEDGLLRAVKGCEQIDAIIAALEDPNRIPEFSVDYLLRKKSARAARRALKLFTMLEVVSVDTSISGVRGEVLRPDIVAYNRDAGAFVLIEVKRDTKTEREAITELVAYEQELRNQLPMMSKLDVALVIVSTEWSPLLDHAVSGMITWDGKTCLCLRLEINGDGNDISLSVHIPDAWHALWSRRLPEKALTTVQLCPYDRSARGADDTLDDGAIARTMQSAFDLIVREGERTGSHGFALLWRDHLPESESSYVITVGAIDPRAFLRESLAGEVWSRENDLHRFFERHIDAPEHHGVHTDGLMDTTTNARRLLSEIGRPSLEGLWTWESEYHALLTRAEPIVMGFWGALGEFHEELTLNPGVRGVYAPHLARGGMYMHDARWGLMFLNALALGRAFTEGRITCSLCFMLGALCERLAKIDHMIMAHGGEAMPLRALKIWLQLALAEILADISVWLQNVLDIDADPPALTFGSIREHTDDREQMSRLASWLHNAIIGPRFAFHRRLFQDGVDAAVCTDSILRRVLSKDEAAECRDRLATIARGYIEAACTEYTEQATARTLSDEARARFAELLAACGQPIEETTTFTELLAYAHTLNAWLPAVHDALLAEAFVPHVLPLLDAVVTDVMHDLRQVAPGPADWEWLRQGVERLRSEGRRFPAVVLDQEGMVTTAIIESPMGDVPDPEESVLLMIRHPYADVIKPVRWEELRDGTAFGK